MLKKNTINRIIIRAFLLINLVSIATVSGQSVISVGSGSYASYPPDHEYVGGNASYGTFLDFATNSANIDVTPSKINDPIPTNDWWTSILTQEDGDGNRHGGNLWAYPLLTRATTSGVEIGHRTAKDWTTDILGSRSMSVDYLISITGSSFTPTKTIAMNWSDWHVDLRTQVGDNSTNSIDFTLVQGMPYTWVKTVGFDPIINALHAGVRTYYDANGAVLSFPATVDRLSIAYDGNLYGIHFSETVTLEQTTQGFSISNYADKWIVFSAINSLDDLDTLHQHAFVKPTDTSLDYSYDPSQGAVTATYNITTEVISGNETDALQGFIPHHYRGNANTFPFLSDLEYIGTPRGTIKMATGSSFTFNYEFNADLLPHFNVPQTIESEAIPYDPEKMNEMIDNFANDVALYGINGGTYWGGKNLVRVLKYALMAKEAGNSNYTALLNTAKEKVYNWLTYTPGETEFYYSYYPSWKGLIGFNEEYYSAYFTDNHFHYGYLAHAGALLEIAEPGAMDGYWSMLTQIIKTYANWDRTDTNYPYLRTFSPWMGHSFASGLGNSIGNNQESSSEAMQSWAGMFMVAEMTGDTSMRDAAAFGYLTEGRAIADYWYNESGTFDEIGYEKPVTGILEMNRYVYGTFFGAQETYIHGIQWLPISPAYGFWNDFLTQSEANAIVDPIINNMSTDLGGSISADWMNVSLGFKLFFDPESVVSIFDGYWNSSNGTDEYSVAHNPGENALTYYYAHASQNIGIRQSDYRLSLPLSSAFEKNGVMTYVVYNPSDATQTCTVYQNNTIVTSFEVPANSLITTTGDDIINPPSEFVPDPNKTYYIDSPIHNLRLAATGESEYPYTTSTTITGEDVEWKFVDKGNGYWHIDRAAGGTKPRLRSNRTANADMQQTSSAGGWTFYDFAPGVFDNTYFLTLPNGPSSYNRLQVNNSGEVKMVSTASAGTWESFTITEASVTEDVSIHIEAEDYTAMSGVQTENTTDTGGGLNVGWIDAGDWMEYVVDIPVEGTYTINFRVASIPGDATFQFQIDGNTLVTTNVDATGGWQNWITISETVALSAGTQTIRINSTNQNWNLNWLQIESGVSARSLNTGIVDTPSIKAYPIPAKDVLNISIPTPENYQKLEIIDLKGSVLFQDTNITKEINTINIDRLPNGLFLVKIYKLHESPQVIRFVK
ncbi:glycosyl hydrolase [Aquimarina pacifica]|uniref:glycosyl hydrolase n=1 Tax=Aquimarina pacifica TaxID=1296415 RepID=UPI00046E6426|nr:glycosyl hydrolase [Aquimarina pacifica]